MTKGAVKTSITLPATLEKELKALARTEQRSLSGVLQEAARFYINTRQWDALQRKAALKAHELGIRTEDDVVDMIHTFRADHADRL